MSLFLDICLTSWGEHDCELRAGHQGAHECECEECATSLAA